MIVSKTDIKGRLTFFNDPFVTISGFTEKELMGQPHNIVRHPDMPPEAFEDLWATLKAGKPWAGAVKNRRMSVRIELDRLGKLEFAGGSVKIHVSNLSEGGALLDHALPDIQIDTPVTLLIDGVAARLSGVVARVDGGGTLIAFRLTEAAEKTVQALVSSRIAA